MKAREVFKILLANGWEETSRESSHIKLFKQGFGIYIFSFSMGEDIGPKMLSKICKHTGIQKTVFINPKKAK